MEQPNFPPDAEQAVAQMSDEFPATSDLSASPDAQSSAPVIDPAEWEAVQSKAARADAIERELEATRQQNARYEQQMAQQMAQAWQQEEARVMQAAREHTDPDQALAMTRDYYLRREQAYAGAVRQRDQAIHTANVNAWIDKNIQEHGLSDADRAQLAWVAQQNPDAVPAEAQRIKAQRHAPNAETAQLRQQVEQLTRAMQAAGIRQSGAWQTGGTNPQPVSQEIKPGSDAHLRQLLG